MDEKHLTQAHKLILEDETYKIIGACLNVHNKLGCGFLEPVYQEALEKEFLLLDIPFEREKEMRIYYKGEALNKQYQADFICYDEIILELKALSNLNPVHESQIINYLKATNMKLGLLVNFGQKSLEKKRVYNKFHL